MTITYVGAGTSSVANNAAVTPVVNASTATGDYVVVHVSSGNVAATWNTPTGWTRIAGTANHRAYARVWQSGDTIPAFTPSGGAAGDDTIGQTFTLRGVEGDVLAATGGADTSPVQTNVSAQNVAYPALAMPGNAHAAVMLLWKRDDATSYTTPASWAVASPLSSTTTGNDASAISYYQIQATDTDIVAGSVVVTGGAAAVSSAIMFYLRPAAAIAVTEQSTWPVRTLISVTGLTVGDDVAVYRVVAGTRTLVRAGQTTATDPAYLIVDAELPFGVPVSYVAVVNDVVEYTSATDTYELTGGKVAITDALNGLAAETVIQEWPSRRRERRSSVFRIGGRNVVVTGPLGQFTSGLTLYTETTESAENLRSLLAEATGGTVQIRQPGGYDDIDCYVVVIGFDDTRYDEADGRDERRLFALDVAEGDAWPGELEAVGYTLEDLANVYTGLTLADLEGDYSTLLALAQAELPT